MPTEHDALDVNQVFAYRLQEVRKSKGWDQQRLAEEMAALGFGHISRSTISKIESARVGIGGGYGSPPVVNPKKARPVSLAEAVAFAVALGVSPASLFLPSTTAVDVMLTPTVRVRLQDAYEWTHGEQPLVLAELPEHEQDIAPAFYRFQDPRRLFPRESTLTIEDMERRGVKVTRLSPGNRKEQDQ